MVGNPQNGGPNLYGTRTIFSSTIAVNSLAFIPLYARRPYWLVIRVKQNNNKSPTLFSRPSFRSYLSLVWLLRPVQKVVGVDRDRILPDDESMTDDGKLGKSPLGYFGRVSLAQRSALNYLLA